jgi:ATP-binding cassette subfamily B protein
MFRQSPELTFYTVCPLPILSFAIFKISRKINLKSKVVQESISKLSSFSQEIFSAIKIIKSYAIQETTKKKFNKISKLNKDNQIELVRIQAMFFPLMIFLIGISNLFVIYIGGSKYLDGSIQQLGIIAEFIIYVNMLTWPVASLGWISSVVQQAEASQKRINEFLKQKNDIIQHGKISKNISGKIKVENLSYKYDDSGIKALKKINFCLEAGNSLGIIGSTGSGKTSLINTILRTLDFDNGKILIDDISIKKFDIQKLRAQIGIVNQDSFLFSDSISNNVRFGSKKEDITSIIRVSKICSIHNEIINFKNQYSTLLGERGVNLSGGQKQRLCIARALVKNPKILILDDCLSALDNKTENEILKKIKKNYKNSSKIIVSHRVSSIQDCDDIIVMHDGEIIQIGKHNDLINTDGYYKNLFLDQSNNK